MTPEPGDEVMVVFRGVAEAAYRAGGHPDGELLDMIPVRLPAGHLIFVPLVDGVAIGPDPEAAGT